MNEEERRKNYELASKLMSEQNFAAAFVAGAVATLLAAAAYGITVVVWPFSYGFAVAAIGVVIGLSIGFLGRGISAKFAVIATVFTIAGCILGSLFVVVVSLAQRTGSSVFDVLRNSSVSMLAERSIYDMSFIDLLFWFVAVVCAVFLARRPLSRSERLAIGLFKMRG